MYVPSPGSAYPEKTLGPAERVRRIERSSVDTRRVNLFGIDAGPVEQPDPKEGQHSFADAEEEVTASHDTDNREELATEARRDGKLESRGRSRGGDAEQPPRSAAKRSSWSPSAA